VVSGSLEMFSNKFFGISKNQNKVYSKNLVEWLSLERGTVRKGDFSYSCIDKMEKIVNAQKDADLGSALI
jgi:hypothetical protein